MASPTTVYFNPRQRKALFARARKRGTSFSEELRSAVDLYLDLPADFDEASFGARQLAATLGTCWSPEQGRASFTLTSSEHSL